MGINKDQIKPFIAEFISRQEDEYPDLEKCLDLSEQVVTKFHENGLFETKCASVTVEVGTTEVEHYIVLVQESSLSNTPVIVDPGFRRFGNETDCKINIDPVDELEETVVCDSSDIQYDFYTV